MAVAKLRSENGPIQAGSVRGLTAFVHYMSDEDEVVVEVHEERRKPFVTVQYTRKIQPKQYESAELQATVGSGSVDLEDVEDVRNEMSDMLAIAMDEVHYKFEKSFGRPFTKTYEERKKEAEDKLKDELDEAIEETKSESEGQSTPQSMEDIIKEVEDGDE